MLSKTNLSNVPQKILLKTILRKDYIRGSIMLINAEFGGIVEKVINGMLHKGIASSKAEAIRIIALEYYKTNRALISDEKSYEEYYVDSIDSKLHSTNQELLKKGVLSKNEFV
jgi:hypothetical protein